MYDLKWKSRQWHEMHSFAARQYWTPKVHLLDHHDSWWYSGGMWWVWSYVYSSVENLEVFWGSCNTCHLYRELAADGRPAACIRAVEDHRCDVVNWAQENSSGGSGMCRISSCCALSKRTLHQLTINIHLLCGKTAAEHGEGWEFDSPGFVDRSHSEYTTLSDLWDAPWSQCWPIPNWNLQMFVSCSPVMAPFFSTLPTVVKSSPVSPREHRPSAISGTGAILSSGTIWIVEGP